MVLYVNPENQPNISRILTFYVDDSACEIAALKHTLLGAITFQDDAEAIARVVDCKQRLQIRPEDEIKWNSPDFTKEQRHAITEEILPILKGTRGFLIIAEQSKQESARMLATQVSDFCRSENRAGFVLRFDKNIITDSSELDRSVYSLNPPCVGWSEVDSAHDQLMQCADLFLGFQKLRIDFSLERSDADKLVEVEVYEGGREEYPISWYLFASLRYSLWGQLEEGYSEGEPWKRNLGFGVRVYSSLPSEIISKAVSRINREYVGCIH
ncbi:MAG: hypothetical protein HY648_00745 [Acidobacteria bacterium]|nr:hypothetical protein [Acidobacteriota bacterium]